MIFYFHDLQFVFTPLCIWYLPIYFPLLHEVTPFVLCVVLLGIAKKYEKREKKKKQKKKKKKPKRKSNTSSICCLCPLNMITSPSPLKNQRPSREYPSTQKEELEALQPLEPHSFI